MTADDSSVCTDGSAFLYQRSHIFASANNGTSRINDIGEDHRRAKENIILTDNSGVNADVVLNLHIAAKPYFGGNENVLAYVAALTNLAAGDEVAEMPDFSALADFATGINNSG